MLKAKEPRHEANAIMNDSYPPSELSTELNSKPFGAPQPTTVVHWPPALPLLAVASCLERDGVGRRTCDSEK